MWIILLLIHGLMAVALLGALTHQSVSLLRRGTSKRSFLQSFAAVRAAAYTNAIVVLYSITLILGGWLYTAYRYRARPVLEATGMLQAVAFFDLKEHTAAIGCFLLPAYWLLWARVPLTEQRSSRAALTVLLALCVWFSFLTGHVLNDLRGL